MPASFAEVLRRVWGGTWVAGLALVLGLGATPVAFAPAAPAGPSAARTPVVDLLFAANLGVGILVLLTVMEARRAREFSTFPLASALLDDGALRQAASGGWSPLCEKVGSNVGRLPEAAHAVDGLAAEIDRACRERELGRARERGSFARRRACDARR